MLDKIITYSFYSLFFLTPLFWTSKNYELFEYNKMMLTYSFTVLIVGAWVLKMIDRKSLIFSRTPLDIPLLLFLGANILSTIFSVDVHTSIWGYYSRSNGGLLSIISYLALYFAFVSNMNPAKVLNSLKFGLASGFLISVWAISEHFGVSPSCIILRNEFNTSCWIQDVRSRVFATLGQPNWLAAYLAMLIFPTLYFFLTSKTKLSQYSYYLILATYYLAFTFTYSRGPTLGLIGGLVIFLGFYYIQNTRKTQKARTAEDQRIRFLKHWLTDTPILRVLLSFLVINLLFGSALTSFRLVSKFAVPLRPTISLPKTPSSGTQLENGGTESGQIRFIVWQGALRIFKAYPIFGSGLETFAYSYYQFRPASHNLTSEWDFLYNKAHNEYLNYLATTGIVGFSAYSIMIITFIIFILKKRRTKNLLLFSVFASYISYLVYNFFLFSVVIIAIFFYLFPAIAFVAAKSTKPLKLPKLRTTNYKLITNLIYRRPIYTKVVKGVVIFSTIYLLFSIFQLWYADTLFSKGEKMSDLGNPGKAYNLLTVATDLNRGEPFYRSELAYSAAAAAASLKDTDATLSATLKDAALAQLAISLRISPKNVSFWRTGVRTYFELASLDDKFIDDTLKTLDQTINLAPTDPKPYYNKALILGSLGKKEEEIKALEKAIELKSNYSEATIQLKEATESANISK